MLTDIKIFTDAPFAETGTKTPKALDDGGDRKPIIVAKAYIFPSGCALCEFMRM